MNVYRSFAEVLDYPGPELFERTVQCSRELAGRLPEAEQLVRTFQESRAALGIAHLQELYTSTFDMRAECTLNLGYHLFGEDQRRGLFLARLKELYQLAKVDTGSELSDHLCWLLRYLATEPGTSEAEDIVTDCLCPAVSKIVQGLSEASNPYRAILDALLLWIERERGSTPVPAEASRATPESTTRGG
jgi:nitrate reductase molybdenum cofactor assembly chaperone NarJ/NarW